MFNTNTSRRTFLATTGGITGVILAGCSSSSGSTDNPNTNDGSTTDSNLEEWMGDVDNYDGVADETGHDTVAVTVGSDGGYAFGPAAVKVSPGTTVVWEWSGEGGGHDVTAEDGSFESEYVDEAGHTFEHTFEETGTTKYVCSPHETMSMKGAVIVE